MTPPRRELPYGERADPQGPFGQLMHDLIQDMAYEKVAEELIRTAQHLDNQTPRYSRFTIRNWIARWVRPQPEALRWIAHTFPVSISDLAKAAEETKRLRARLKNGPQGESIANTSLADQSTLAVQVREVTETPYPLPASTMHGDQHPGIPLVLDQGSTLPYRTHEDSYTMMRRDFLQRMLVVATGAVASYPPSNTNTPEQTATMGAATPDLDLFAHECETNILACWPLMSGRLMVVVPSILTAWLPSLDAAIIQQSAHRTRLAVLGAQGYILGGLVMALRGQYDRAEWFSKQAVDYATLSGDVNLTVAALKHLATRYISAQLPLLTLSTYERAMPLLSEASPLLRGRVHLGLALANAHVGKQADAERHLELAHLHFPEQPEDDPAFLYADCRRASLDHYGGLIQLLADHPRDAYETFSAAIDHSLDRQIPERTVVQFINCQAQAALHLEDVELTSNHLEVAAQGAQVLMSPKRFSDSLAIYQHARIKWPSDRRLKRLEPLFANAITPPTG